MMRTGTIALMLLLAALFAVACGTGEETGEGTTAGDLSAEDPGDMSHETGGDSSGEAAPARKRPKDIAYPDTIVGLVHKKTGMFELIFADHDNSKYVKVRRSPPTTWRFLNTRKLAIPASGTTKITSNFRMKKIMARVRRFGFFDKAVEITGMRLDRPMPGAAVIVETNNRAWRLDVPSPGASRHKDIFLACRIGLVEEAQRIPSYQFSQTSAASAFTRNPPKRR